MRFRLELSESIKAQGSGTMRLPEAQVAHGVPGAIHSLPGVSAPDRLRHDSCDSPRQRRKAHRPQFPWQQGRGTREAEEMLRAQPKVSCTAPQARARSESAQVEVVSAVRLGYCGVTAYHVCDKARSHLRLHVMHLINEETKAVPSALFV